MFISEKEYNTLLETIEQLQKIILLNKKGPRLHNFTVFGDSECCKIELEMNGDIYYFTAIPYFQEEEPTRLYQIDAFMTPDGRLKLTDDIPNSVEINCVGVPFVKEHSPFHNGDAINEDKGKVIDITSYLKNKK